MKNRALRLDEYGIESLLKRSQKWLYNYEPQRVWYPSELYKWQGSIEESMFLFKQACYSSRNEFLDLEVHNNKNIYAIWTEPTRYSKRWKLRYIGQRHSSGIKDRLKNHLFFFLFDSVIEPNSKFEDVFNSLINNQMIYVSYVQVIPESLRTFIEQSLICINSYKGEDLWNTHGSKNTQRDLDDLHSSGINVNLILKI